MIIYLWRYYLKNKIEKYYFVLCGVINVNINEYF